MHILITFLKHPLSGLFIPTKQGILQDAGSAVSVVMVTVVTWAERGNAHLGLVQAVNSAQPCSGM